MPAEGRQAFRLKIPEGHNAIIHGDCLCGFEAKDAEALIKHWVDISGGSLEAVVVELTDS